LVNLCFNKLIFAQKTPGAAPELSLEYIVWRKEQVCREHTKNMWTVSVELFFGNLAGRQTDAKQAEILDVKTALEQKYESKMAFFKQWEQDVVRSPAHQFHTLGLRRKEMHFRSLHPPSRVRLCTRGFGAIFGGDSPSYAGARALRGGVTRQGRVLDDLQSLLDCQ
jgi:hypothetical protein